MAENAGMNGTDIMAQNNTPGIYPVLSATAGTVTNIGWLELGGWRIGITSENGIYYYYAHLDSYAPAVCRRYSYGRTAAGIYG